MGHSDGLRSMYVLIHYKIYDSITEAFYLYIVYDAIDGILFILCRLYDLFTYGILFLSFYLI